MIRMGSFMLFPLLMLVVLFLFPLIHEFARCSVAYDVARLWRLGIGNRRERDRRVARQAPVVFGVERWRAAAAIARVFARPQRHPSFACGRRKQRLRRR